MINPWIQNVFYHYVLSDAALTAKWEPYYFDAKGMQVCFKYAKEYVEKYHVAPSANQMKELLHIADAGEDVNDEFVDILYSSAGRINEYAQDWLFENATSWGSWKHFCTALKNTNAYVKLHQDEVTVENVKEIMEQAKGSFTRNCIVDFNGIDDMGSDFWDANSHKQAKMKRSPTGYQFIDTCMKGGAYPGCLVCFAGAPKSGKSLWLQNLCAESVKMGEDCCYVSLELPEEMIHSRIGANMFSIPALDYEKYSDDVDGFSDRIKSFRKGCIVPPGQLIVKQFPTSTLSVPELETYLLKKEEELSTENRPFKFKNVYVDYINILKNYRNPNSEQTYMKIKQLAEDLKAIGIKNNWAIFTATQTNRGAEHKEDVTSDQIAESSGLGATVDLMFAIIATVEMSLNGMYELKCLYDRVAPYANKKKAFILNQTYLRITEDMNAPIEDVLEEGMRTARNYCNEVRGGAHQVKSAPASTTLGSTEYQMPVQESPQTMEPERPVPLVTNEMLSKRDEPYKVDSSVGYTIKITGNDLF